MKGRPGFITWTGLAVVFAAAAVLSFSALAELAEMVGMSSQAGMAVPRLHRRGCRRVDGGVAITAAQPGRGTIRPPTHLGIARLDRRRERSPPGPGGSGHGPAMVGGSAGRRHPAWGGGCGRARGGAGRPRGRQLRVGTRSPDDGRRPSRRRPIRCPAAGRTGLPSSSPRARADAGWRRSWGSPSTGPAPCSRRTELEADDGRRTGTSARRPEHPLISRHSSSPAHPG